MSSSNNGRVHAYKSTGQGEDTAATLNRAVTGLHLVDEAHALQPVYQTNGLFDPLRLNAAVNLPRHVANAKNLDPDAWPKRIGFFSHEGQDFLIYGEWFYAVNDLRLHGVIPEGGSDLGYVAKYLRRMVGDAPAEGVEL